LDKDKINRRFALQRIQRPLVNGTAVFHQKSLTNGPFWWSCFRYRSRPIFVTKTKIMLCILRNIMQFSLRFNGHSPGETGLAGVYWSKGWRKWWWQLEL